MLGVDKMSRRRREKMRVTRRKRALTVQMLENRQLLAFNVVDDALTVVSGRALNVLANDTSGAEVQNVSAFQADLTNPNPGGNDTDWFIPLRDDGVTPQRSIITGAVMFQDGRPDGFNGGANWGDIDLLRDTDADFTNDDQLTNAAALDAADGIGLPVIRNNDPVGLNPVTGTMNTNIGVPQFQTEGGGGSVWIAIAAGPENNGEFSTPVSNAFFPYDAGWAGGSFNSGGGVNAGGAGLAVEGSGGRYTASVAGVTDSYNDGYLFGVGGDNEDNYTRVRPVGGNSWAVQHRDNSGNINNAEADDFNLLYIPASAQGLIGGVVDASETGVNPMLRSYGDFSIERESDGFWRLSVPGQNIRSGVLVMETFDLTTDQPRNSYFTYDAATDNPDEIIIRQFEWTSSDVELPLNTDFTFFFVPFENTLNPAPVGLTITDVGTALDPSSGFSDSGMPLTINPDGTVGYDLLSKLDGESGVDTFVYTVTDGSSSLTGTATVNWKGANDAPFVIGSIPDQLFNEDDPGVDFDLTTIFEDVDAGDVLTFSTSATDSNLVDTSVNGSMLDVAPAANAFGSTVVSVTATDTAGATATVSFLVEITPLQDDGVVAVDDGVLQVDNGSTLTVSVLDNDYHGDAGQRRVSAASISVDAEATDNGGSAWSIAATHAAPHGLSIQSSGNLGDVAVGYDGSSLDRTLGVLLGTASETTVDGRSVNTYDAFGSYGFATDRGAGSGGQERNQPVSAAFFPFENAWTGAWVDAAGSVQAGVGVSSANIVKLNAGLYQVTVPDVNIASEDGMLFAMGGNNDDNIVSILPSTIDNTWLVRQQDNDSAADGLSGFEDDSWHFVYVPGTAANLIGGRYTVPDDVEEGGQPQILQQYGAFTVEYDDSVQKATISVPGYTPDQGALIAISSDFVFVDPGTGPVPIPDNYTVEAYPSADGTKWVVDSRRTSDFVSGNREVQFMFLPYDQVLQRYDNLGFGVDPAATDATSVLGATLTINADGTIDYDPSSSSALTALGFSESLVDTFTYGILGEDGSTATATVTVEVFGESVGYQTSVGPTVYDIGSGPLAVDAGLQLVELGSPNLDGATLNFSLAGGRDGDLLSLENQGAGAGQVGVSGSDITFGGVVVGTFVGGTNGDPLVVTLNSSASNEAVGAIGSAVQFESSDETLVGDRVVSFEIVGSDDKSSGVASKRVQARNVAQYQQGVDFGDGAYMTAANSRIQQNDPDSVIDTSTVTLGTDFDTNGNAVESLLRFNDLFGTGPGQIPPDAIITSADLLLSTTNPGDGATLHRMLTDWDSTTLTWNTFGGGDPAVGVPTDDVIASSTFDSQVGVVNGSGSTGTGLISFSVLPDLRTWADGEANFGWLLKGWDGNTDGWDFQSSEHSVLEERPRLRVEWIPASAATATSFQDGVDGYDATVDTDLRGFDPDADQSQATSLFSDAPETQALMRFDDIIGSTLGQIPAGATILTARLTLGSTVSDAMGDGGKFHAMLTDWADTDSWNSLGGGVQTDGVQASATYDAQAGEETLNPDVQGGFNTFDVTADVERWVSGDLTNYGWLIDFWNGGSNGWGFASSETASISERPKLEVYFDVSGNVAPTDITLTPDELSEFADTTGGLLVGALEAVDPNPGDTFTYELLPGVNDNALFAINGDELVINDGVSLDYETRPSYVVSVRAIDAGGLTFERELMISVINEIELEGLTVGDGSAQRSRLSSLTVSFDSDVTLGSGAFEVIKRGAGGGNVDVVVSSELVDGKTVATLTFAGGFVENLASGSLVDGNYQLRIDGSLITNSLGSQFDGDGDGQPGGDLLFGTDEADDFFRFYGDVTGDRSVNFVDFLQFRGAFGSTDTDPEYREDFDSNADGNINFVDFLQFRSRFGGALSFE